MSVILVETRSLDKRSQLPEQAWVHHTAYQARSTGVVLLLSHHRYQYNGTGLDQESVDRFYRSTLRREVAHDRITASTDIAAATSACSASTTTTGAHACQQRQYNRCHATDDIRYAPCWSNTDDYLYACWYAKSNDGFNSTCWCSHANRCLVSCAAACGISNSRFCTCYTPCWASPHCAAIGTREHAQAE